MGVVGTANRGLIIYKLDGTPAEFKRMESPLKYQHRCISIFKDKASQQPTGNYKIFHLFIALFILGTYLCVH